MFDTVFRNWFTYNHILRLARYVYSWYDPSQHYGCNLPSDKCDTPMIQVRYVFSQPARNTAADTKAGKFK